MITELCVARVVFQSLERSWQTALYTYLCDRRDPINQGHVFFFVFHFELTRFSDGQLSKVSARPTVFNWEIYVTYGSVGPRITSGTGLIKIYLVLLFYRSPKKHRLIISTVGIGHTKPGFNTASLENKKIRNHLA